jgi:Fe-S-cluster-containing hydrogenase component 2
MWNQDATRVRFCRASRIPQRGGLLHVTREKKDGKTWGKGNYPEPREPGLIECDELKCNGCGICQMACSMRHFGIINKDLARIQVNKFLLPISKGIQVTCVQCQDEERACQPACPVEPSAIYYDHSTLHMVIDKERCLGDGCMKCREACPAKAIRNHPKLSPLPFVCDLCDTQNNGDKNPQCVSVCPTEALYYKSFEVFGYPLRDYLRKSASEKASLVSQRLHPLPKDTVWQPEGSE